MEKSEHEAPRWGDRKKLRCQRKKEMRAHRSHTDATAAKVDRSCAPVFEVTPDASAICGPETLI